jgi:DNA-binding response OmpR family regulator
MVLLVAGHPETRDALTPLISANGFEVKALDCDDAVIPFVQFQKPSIVILDCGLHHSFRLMEHIRSEPRVCTTPVIMFSVDDENVREKALLKGADAYVPKGSLDWAELLTEISRFAGPPSE